MNQEIKITSYNWRNFQNNFNPPLIGPNDFRILSMNHKRKLFYNYLDATGIPRIIAKEKYLKANIEFNKSILITAINNPDSLNYKFYSNLIREDEKSLRHTQALIKRLIA